jgi:hypothetical protein
MHMRKGKDVEKGSCGKDLGTGEGHIVTLPSIVHLKEPNKKVELKWRFRQSQGPKCLKITNPDPKTSPNYPLGRLAD